MNESIKQNTSKEHSPEVWQEEYLNWQNQNFDESKTVPVPQADVLSVKDTTVDVPIATSAPETLDQKPMSNQLDRLIEKTRNLRETTGLSHKEALAELSNFSDVRASIRSIRNEIKQIEKKGDTQERREEIQRLRNALAAELTVFRKLNHNGIAKKSNESADAKGEPQNGEVLKALTETFETTVQNHSIHGDGVIWYQEHISKDISFAKIFEYLQHNFSDADTKFRDKIYQVVKTQITFQRGATEIASMLKNTVLNETELEGKIETLQKVGRQVDQMQKRFNRASIYEQQEAVNFFEDFGVTSRDYVPPATPDKEPAASTFAERIVVRNEWKQKKQQYEDEYKKYLEAEKEKREHGSRLSKLAFWRNKSKPEALVHMEKEYQDARRAYAEMLGSALLDRFDTNTTGMNAGLANRFVIQSAEDRKGIEKQYLNEKQSKLFESLQQIFSEHRVTIKKIGFISTVATGSLFGVARLGVTALKNYITSDPAHAQSILAQYTLGGIKALSAFSAVALGAGAGAYAGVKLGEYNVSSKGRKKDSIRQKAQTSFSTEKIDQFEKEYLASAAALEQAISAKKKIVAASAILGAAAGAVISGGIDIDHVHQKITNALENIPDVQPSSVLDSLTPQVIPGVSHKQIFDQIPNDVVSPKVDLGVAVEHTPKIIHDQIPVTDEALSMKESLKPGTTDGTIPNKVPPLIDDLPDGRLPDEPVVPEITPNTEGNEANVSGENTEAVEGSAEEETDENEDQSDALNVVPEYEIPYTFEPDSNTDSVSEALRDVWIDHKEFIGTQLKEDRFMQMFKMATDDLQESNPDYYRDLLGKMGITSGDINDVAVGQQINLAPMFEYLKEYCTPQ